MLHLTMPSGYNPSLPNFSVLPISVLITIFALIIAFYPLVDIRIKFRLKVKKWITKLLWCLISLGTIFVIIASFLPVIEGSSIWYWGYPLFWEYLALVFIVLGISLLVTYFKPIRINKWNYKNYFNNIRIIISEGTENDINRIIDETYYSLERLFSKISLDDKKMNEIEGYYHACIILFSDSQFSRLIVTRNPKFLYHFFRFIIQKNEKEAEKNKCLLKKLQPIVSCLLTQSILNSDSILRKENDYQEALSYFDDFTSLIFKNYALLNSSLNLFDFNIKTTHCYTSDEVSMICRWYETAFDFYINNDVKKGVPRNLIVGFHYLNEIVRHCVNQRGINKGDALELFSCCTAVGDVYEKALSYLSNNPPTTFNEKYSDFNNTTCVEYIGMKVYKYIETLSIDKDVWLFHLGTCSLWEYLKILDDDANKPLINTLKKKFQDELKKTITRNLNTQQPRYPLVIKGLIFECNLYPATENTIFKLVNDELKKRFYALYSFSKEKALELLPEDAKYDENTHELIYYNRVSYTEYRLEININGD